MTGEELWTWVASVAGPVTDVRRLPGATSVDLYATDRVVVKHYVNTEWLAREPDLAVREAAALEVLAGSGVVAPRLVAVRDDVVVMTRLDGVHHWDPPRVEPLAEVALAIHAVGAPAGFRPYRRYVRDPVDPPVWSSRPALWERAFEIAANAVVDDARSCFIHRDHHAGNVLWSHGRVSGVVDWVEACVGPPAVDAARMRWNLVVHAGADAAARYARQPGVVVDPVWDVVDAIDSLWAHGPATPHRDVLEAFVAASVSALDGH